MSRKTYEVAIPFSINHPFQGEIERCVWDLQLVVQNTLSLQWWEIPRSPHIAFLPPFQAEKKDMRKQVPVFRSRMADWKLPKATLGNVWLWAAGDGTMELVLGVTMEESFLRHAQRICAEMWGVGKYFSPRITVGRGQSSGLSIEEVNARLQANGLDEVSAKVAGARCLDIPLPEACEVLESGGVLGLTY